MRVLIAEDDPAFRNLLEDILQQWGYEVIAARDGVEAWQALRTPDSPRLALLDWKMPGIDGLQICQLIRKEAPVPYRYLILLTSQQRGQDLVTGMGAGADDYLSKPLKTAELKVRLEAGRRIVALQNELLAAREELAAHAAALQGANRDLEAFGYAVANDILKSLMAIGDYAKAIGDLHCGDQDLECRNYTRRIYEKTRGLAELIGGMHEFFRPPKVELQRETVNLSATAHEIAELLCMGRPSRRAVFHIAEGLTAEGDPGMLQTVLRVLLHNAWKHSAQREESVIDFGAADSDGETVYFVRDNGVGFDMAHADLLFKPFQRLPGTEEFGGKGTGLATVERMVVRLGGRVWGEGASDRGATFYFTLPGGRKSNVMS